VEGGLRDGHAVEESFDRFEEIYHCRFRRRGPVAKI